MPEFPEYQHPVFHNHVHHHHYEDRRLETLLERIITMSAELDAKITTLQGDVTALTDVDTSAAAMITGLSAELAAALQAAQAAGATPAQLTALDDLHATLSAKTAELAAAVAANTPAPAPAPAVVDPAPAADPNAPPAGADTTTAPV